MRIKNRLYSLTFVLRVCAANGLRDSMESGLTRSCVAISHAPIYVISGSVMSHVAEEGDGADSVLKVLKPVVCLRNLSFVC